MPRTAASSRFFIPEGTQYALSFNGTSALVSVGNDASLKITSAWTLCAWVKPTERPQGSGVISHTFTTGVVTYELGYGMDEAPGGSSKLKAGFFDGSVWRTVSETPDGGLADVGSWTHIAANWNGTSLRLFRNGTFITAATPGGTPGTNTNNFLIGRRHDVAGTKNFFPGLIDDARIYNTNLSDQLIQDIYYGKPVTTANLVSRWKFNEGSGSSAADSQGSNTGTITAATYTTEVFSIPRSAASNRPNPSSFSPSDISGLKLWFKADGLALNDLDTVSSWTDFSSNANHLVATSAPVYRTNQINGLPAVAFSGHYLATASISMSQWTTFMVFTPGGGNMYVLSWGPAGSEGRHFISNFASNTVEYYNSPRISLGSTVNGTWSIHSAKISGSDTTTYKNGVQVATSGTVASDGNGIFRAGNYSSGGANGFVGSIAEIIVYESALSSGDLSSVHSYLGTKYGIS